MNNSIKCVKYPVWDFTMNPCNPWLVFALLFAQYIPQVKQALADSGLNVNPQQDGTSLFIPLPK